MNVASSPSTASQPPQYRDEILKQLEIALPVIVTFFVRRSTDLVSVVFVGHLGPEYMGAVGLASVTANVTGYSLAWGLCGALSTMASQAFGAHDNSTLNAVLMQAITILWCCLCVPVSLIWYYSEKIMVALGQDETLAKNAGDYLTMLIPHIWTASVCISFQNWMYSQSKTRPSFIISLINCILHPLWCYLYIYYFGFGYIGAAMAVVTTNFIELLAFLLYLNVFSTTLKDTGFTINMKDCFSNWGAFLKLGCPNLLMMAEWWASEIIIFMSGTFANSPQIQVSTMSIYTNTLSLCYMLPAAFQVAASTRVGNLLGENKASSAKMASAVSCVLAAIVSFTATIIILCLGSSWGRLFTNNKEVLSNLAKIMPFMAVYLVADGLQTALTGVIKGMGSQHVAFPAVIFSYYVVGIPVSVYAAYNWPSHRGLGLVGLCIGTTVGTILHFLIFGVIVYRTDWEAQCSLAKVRLSQSQSNSVNSTNKSNSSNNNSSSSTTVSDSTSYNPVHLEDSSQHGGTTTDDSDLVEEIKFIDDRNPESPLRRHRGMGLGYHENRNSLNWSDIQRSFRDTYVSAYNNTFSRFLGFERKLFEYEMVQSYITSSFEDDLEF